MAQIASVIKPNKRGLSIVEQAFSISGRILEIMERIVHIKSLILGYCYLFNVKTKKKLSDNSPQYPISDNSGHIPEAANNPATANKRDTIAHPLITYVQFKDNFCITKF